jgi:hypothetical protein
MREYCAHPQAAEAARRGTRVLDPDKAAEVTARVLEDKMLFQEGVRLGLDQDDPIIRPRVVQKVLLLAGSYASRPGCASSPRYFRPRVVCL